MARACYEHLCPTPEGFGQIGSAGFIVFVPFAGILQGVKSSTWERWSLRDVALGTPYTLNKRDTFTDINLDPRATFGVTQDVWRGI